MNRNSRIIVVDIGGLVVIIIVGVLLLVGYNVVHGNRRRNEIIARR